MWKTEPILINAFVVYENSYLLSGLSWFALIQTLYQMDINVSDVCTYKCIHHVGRCSRRSPQRLLQLLLQQFQQRLYSIFHCVVQHPTKLDSGACLFRRLQLFINATTKNVSLLIKDVTLNTTLTLRGFNANDFQKYPTSTQYQPVLVANHTYRLTWNNVVAPNNIDLSIYNFPQ